MRLKLSTLANQLKRCGSLLAVTALLLAVPPHNAALAATVRQAQWHIDTLQLSTAQTISRGDGVTVAVIDSGVELHPDLAGHVLTGRSFGEAAPLSAQEDIDGHGTAMAGLIAGQGGGDNNVLGVAPGAQILPLRISAQAHAADSYGHGDVSGSVIAQAIRWAADNGAKVINISLATGGSATDEEKSAVSYALSRDVVIVVGAGNGDTGQSSLGHFALVPGVIVVNATDQSGTIWNQTIPGKEVSLSAPGVDIVSTNSRASGSKTGFTVGSGTSNSAAIVSGAATLIRSKYPDLKVPDVINRLITTADDAGSPGRDNLYGFGRLNIIRALNDTVPHVTANPLGSPEGTGINSSSGSQHDASTAGNRLTPQALAGLIIFGLILATPIVLLIRKVLRRRKHSPTQPQQPISYTPAPPTTPSDQPSDPNQQPRHPGQL